MQQTLVYEKTMPMSVDKDANVFVFGDVHGDSIEVYDRIETLLADNVLKPKDVIIWLGDVGISYGYIRRDMMRALETMGSTYDFTNVVIRGNHDTRYVRDINLGVFSAYGDVRTFTWCDGSAVSLSNYPHVFFLADAGGVYRIKDWNVLVVPGAFSVDKNYRLSYGWPWEPEEQLTETELDCIVELSCMSDIDIVLSHTCPDSWKADMHEFLMDGLDQSKVDSTMEQALDTVWYNVMPTCKEWWYGHFHGDKDLSNGVGHLLYWCYGKLGDGHIS